MTHSKDLCTNNVQQSLQPDIEDPSQLLGVVGGLWLGPKKPTMISYTEPFIKTLQELETKGVEIKSDLDTFICKAIVIAGSADLPAKSIICNTMQFNGKYGCSKCPRETCKTSEKGHCHVFPFKAENPCGPRRSHAGYLEDVNTAVQNNIICRGINPLYTTPLVYTKHCPVFTDKPRMLVAR